MRVLLDEPRVFVTFGTAFLFCGENPFDLGETDPSDDQELTGYTDGDAYDTGDHYAGQENGICGAAVPGILKLTVGTHTGWVPFRVELHDAAPEPGDDWEEIVDVSFRPAGQETRLMGLDSEDSYPVALPSGDYRVRYNVRGPHDEAYLLQLWPATPAQDRIVRQTSPKAAYWHRTNRRLPLPASEQAADERNQYLLEKYGEVPNARLQAIDGYTAGLCLIDRELLLALSRTDDEKLRQVARRSALQALAAAGLTDHPVTRPAVAALSTGAPIPAPFDTESGLYSVIGSITMHTYVPRLPALLPERGEQDMQQINALAALCAVTNDNALAAAVTAVEATAVTLGPDHYRQFLTDLHAEFPDGQEPNGQAGASRGSGRG